MAPKFRLTVIEMSMYCEMTISAPVKFAKIPKLHEIFFILPPSIDEFKKRGYWTSSRHDGIRKDSYESVNVGSCAETVENERCCLWALRLFYIYTFHLKNNPLEYPLTILSNPIKHQFVCNLVFPFINTNYVVTHGCNYHRLLFRHISLIVLILTIFALIKPQYNCTGIT